MKEKIIEVLEDLKDSDLVYIHNEYCDKINYTDDRIFFMGEIDEMINIEKMSLTEVLDKYRDIDTDYEFFMFTVYGVEAFGDIEDKIDFEDIAEYIIDNDEDFGDSDIREILDEDEE